MADGSFATLTLWLARVARSMAYGPFATLTLWQGFFSIRHQATAGNELYAIKRVERVSYKATAGSGP
jgi:hypothetical protein